VARRDTKEKSSLPVDTLEKSIPELLTEIQNNLLQRAKDFRTERTSYANNLNEFQEILDTKGGFIYAHWDGSPQTEAKIKELTKASIRCIPLDVKEEKGKCVLSGKDSQRRVLFAKAY